MILLKIKSFRFLQNFLSYETKSILSNHIHNFSFIHASLPHDSRGRVHTQLQEFAVYQLILIQITTLFAKGTKETAFHRVFHSVSSNQTRDISSLKRWQRYCFNVAFYFSSPLLSISFFFFPSSCFLFSFFFPPSIDYRYPIEDSTKLSGGVRASACSFALAQCPGD